MGIYKQEGSPYWYGRVKVRGQLFRTSLGTTKKVDANKLFNKWATETRERKTKYAKEKKPIKVPHLFALYFIFQKTKFVKHQEPKASEDNFKYTQNRWIDFLGNNSYVHDLNLDSLLDDYKIAAKNRKVRNRKKRGVSNKTINIEFGFLRAAYKYAKKRKEFLLCEEPEWIDFAEEVEETKGKGMSPENNALLIANSKPHAQNCEYFRSITGLRKGNQMNLKTEMIDWEEMIITFKQKGNRTFELPITPSIENFLKGEKIYDEESNENHVARVKELNLTNLGNVFLYKGKPFKSIRTTHKTIQKNLGFTKIYNEHSSRHTVGKIVGKLSGRDKVMKTLGHSNIKTSKIYDDSDLEVREQELKKIGDMVSKMVSKSKNKEKDISQK